MARTSTNTTVENTENTRSVKSDLAEKVPTVEELNGWITSKAASDLLGIPQTSINNLAYSGDIKAVRIASIFLFEQTSVQAYAPKLKEIQAAKEVKKNQKDLKSHKKEIMAAFKAEVEKAIENGKLPDMNALKEKFGLE
jgi:hypothetical protein